jgi:DNA-directed RNA polymerase specialized sigma24 family protein
MRLALLCSQTDERLVALVRLGHARAFEAIVQRYRRPLLSAHAEPVVDEALGIARGRLGRGEEVQDLRAWLCSIARDTAGRSLFVAVAVDDVARETVATVARLPALERDALLRRACEDELVGVRFQAARTVASALMPLPVVAWLASED